MVNKAGESTVSNLLDAFPSGKGMGLFPVSDMLSILDWRIMITLPETNSSAPEDRL